MSATLIQVQCCFTSTETVRTIKDGEARTATSTFTQFLSSEARLDPQVLVQITVVVRKRETLNYAYVLQMTPKLSVRPIPLS